MVQACVQTHVERLKCVRNEVVQESDQNIENAQKRQ